MNINETNGLQDIEIGISKMPCLLCWLYMNYLNKKYDRCFCEPCTNGKIDTKWCFRENEDPDIINMINQELIKRIEQAIEKRCTDSERNSRKKSDDSDIIATSLEGDDFDGEMYGKPRI
ncbi:hypothetical protein I4U23_029875 [Adineta vaga]|nr:hypothetical protein I4U23_029875 [Adineta vaga]